MIAIIIGGYDLFEEPGARELARETVDHSSVLVAAGARAALEVARHLEAPFADAEHVDVDGETLRVQAGAASPRGSIKGGAGVAPLADAEGAELGAEPLERDGEPAIADD